MQHYNLVLVVHVGLEFGLHSSTQMNCIPITHTDTFIYIYIHIHIQSYIHIRKHPSTRYMSIAKEAAQLGSWLEASLSLPVPIGFPIGFLCNTVIPIGFHSISHQFPIGSTSCTAPAFHCWCRGLNGCTVSSTNGASSRSGSGCTRLPCRATRDQRPKLWNAEMHFVVVTPVENWLLIHGYNRDHYGSMTINQLLIDVNFSMA